MVDMNDIRLCCLLVELTEVLLVDLSGVFKSWLWCLLTDVTEVLLSDLTGVALPLTLDVPTILLWIFCFGFLQLRHHLDTCHCYQPGDRRQSPHHHPLHHYYICSYTCDFSQRMLINLSYRALKTQWTAKFWAHRFSECFPIFQHHRPRNIVMCSLIPLYWPPPLSMHLTGTAVTVPLWPIFAIAGDFSSSGFRYCPVSLRANLVAITNTSTAASYIAAWSSNVILLLPPTLSIIISISPFLCPVSCWLPLLYLTLILCFIPFPHYAPLDHAHFPHSGGGGDHKGRPDLLIIFIFDHLPFYKPLMLTCLCLLFRSPCPGNLLIIRWLCSNFEQRIPRH